MTRERRRGDAPDAAAEPQDTASAPPPSSLLRLRVHRLHPAARLPRYATGGAAGLDLSACLPPTSRTPPASDPASTRKEGGEEEAEEPGGPAGVLTLAPGERRAVPTGLAIALPAGHEGQVRPRSGLALRHGVTVANAPGTIDEDYRGELMVLLINLGEHPYPIRHGDRIAQLVVAPVTQVAVQAVDAPLDETDRGAGGFGSTGA